MRCHEQCKYHGWLGLVQWCRHPDHLEPLDPGRVEAIEAKRGTCSSWVDWEAKVMHGEEPSWPMPVDLAEAFPRQKPQLCTQGVQNRQKEQAT